jgi:hypothetical protein
MDKLYGQSRVGKTMVRLEPLCMDKQELRERVWDDLEESGEARFPFPS